MYLYSIYHCFFARDMILFLILPGDLTFDPIVCKILTPDIVMPDGQVSRSLFDALQDTGL